MIEKLFKLRENNTDVRTEVIGGITTFMTMAYILAVNPSLLSAAGMDATAVLMATCLASFIGTAAMALMANYPFALAPGMGLNAYFAFTVCGAYGYDWRVALLAVFAEGIIFIILSLTNVREAIFNAIPSGLKKGVSAGIGLFIAFVGLQGGHVIVNSDSTLTTYVSFASEFHTFGICALLAIIGTLLIAVLYARNVKGSILIGIIVTWILGMICQAAGIYKVDVEAGFYSLYPTFAITDFTALSKTFGQCFAGDFSNVSIANFVVVLLAFLLWTCLTRSEHSWVSRPRRTCSTRRRSFRISSRRSWRTRSRPRQARCSALPQRRLSWRVQQVSARVPGQVSHRW